MIFCNFSSSISLDKIAIFLKHINTRFFNFRASLDCLLDLPSRRFLCTFFLSSRSLDFSFSDNVGLFKRNCSMASSPGSTYDFGKILVASVACVRLWSNFHFMHLTSEASSSTLQVKYNLFLRFSMKKSSEWLIFLIFFLIVVSSTVTIYRSNCPMRVCAIQRYLPVNHLYQHLFYHIFPKFFLDFFKLKVCYNANTIFDII